MADDIYRLLFETDTSAVQKAADALEELGKASDRAGANVYELSQRMVGASKDVYELGEASVKLEPAVERCGASLADLGKLADGAAVNTDELVLSLQNATKWSDTLGGKKLGLAAAATTATRANSTFALGVNQLAQGVEDLQYSVGGAMNNIASAAMMFGAGGVWVTALTLAGVAVNQLFRHWGDLVDEFGDTAPIQEVGSRVEELEGKLKKALDPEIARAYRAELEGLKADLNTINALAGKQTEQEAASGRAIREGFAATGADRALLRALEQQAIREAKADPDVTAKLNAEAAAQAAVEAAQEATRGPMDAAAAQQASRRLEAAEKQLEQAHKTASRALADADEAGRAAAGNAMRQATEGVGVEQEAAQRELMRQLGGLGTAPARRMADFIGGQAPGRQAEIEREAAAFEREAIGEVERGGRAAGRGIRRAEQRNAHELAQANRQREQLTEQGQAAEREMIEGKLRADAQKRQEVERILRGQQRHQAGMVENELKQQAKMMGASNMEAEAFANRMMNGLGTVLDMEAQRDAMWLMANQRMRGLEQRIGAAWRRQRSRRPMPGVQ